MDKKISLAQKAPVLLAIISAFCVACYMFTVLQTQATIGRPSSTHGIGYFIAPIYSLVVGVIGYVVGLVLKYFLSMRGERNLINKARFLRNAAIICLVLGGGSAGVGFYAVVQHEKFNSPRVLNNSSSITKGKYSEEDSPAVSYSPDIVWEFGNTNYPELEWNGVNLNFKIHNRLTMEIFSDSDLKTSYDFSDYTSYLAELKVLPIPRYLIVLVKLRATSERSMLLIYDKEYNLVYEELLERCGRNQYFGATHDTETLLVNICKPFILNFD